MNRDTEFARQISRCRAVHSEASASPASFA